MPHSSGGGYHGGGSHGGGSHHSSGGGSSLSGLSYSKSSTYRPGYHKYVYYDHNRPNYFYTNKKINKTSPSSVKTLRIIRNILIVFYAIILFSIIWSSIGVPEKIDLNSYIDNGIVIEDSAEYLTTEEESKIYKELEKFQSTTGITPAFITVYNSNWEKDYASLETFAYDIYVNRFKDEKHWLIVYSQPAYPDASFNEWYWEGMQGNDTDNILTGSKTDKFDKTFHKNLVDNKVTLADAVINSFSELNENVLYFSSEAA